MKKAIILLVLMVITLGCSTYEKERTVEGPIYTLTEPTTNIHGVSVSLLVWKHNILFRMNFFGNDSDDHWELVGCEKIPETVQRGVYFPEGKKVKMTFRLISPKYCPTVEVIDFQVVQ